MELTYRTLVKNKIIIVYNSADRIDNVEDTEYDEDDDNHTSWWNR